MHPAGCPNFRAESGNTLNTTTVLITYLQQVFLQNAAAPLPNMDIASTVDASKKLDIYGVIIPDDMCEDALLEFPKHVNAFMESKFEVTRLHHYYAY